MGWERRGNGLYYYLKRRIGGRVVSQYVGKGPMADLLALEAVHAKDDREWQAARRRLAAQEWAELSQAVSGAEREADAMLNAYGLHRPKRGPWRVRRGKKA